MKFAILIALAVAMIAPALANSPNLPPGVTCSMVRAKVAEHGKAYAYAWAKLHGYTAADIREAKKCLR